MASSSYAVVWIDHEQARILPFKVEKTDETAEKPGKLVFSPERSIDEKHDTLFEKVGNAIANVDAVDAVLIVGSATDKFAQFFADRYATIITYAEAAKKAESPTKDEFLALAHRLTSKRQNPFGSYLEAFKIYEDGKHRRYVLLFSVNGGGFAVLKFGRDLKLAAIDLAVPIGMLIFTVLMGYDMWIFGDRMREAIGHPDRKRNVLNWIFGHNEGGNRGVFSRPGRRVLLSCCGLLVVGWTLLFLYGYHYGFPQISASPS